MRQEEFNKKFERLFNGDSAIKQVDVRKAYLSKRKAERNGMADGTIDDGEHEGTNGELR